MPGTVLVTGGAGFVGASLVRALIEQGDEVVAAVRPGSDLWRLEGVDAATVAELDLTDAEATTRSVAEIAPRTVMHLAAHGAYSWQTDSARIFEVNLRGTVNLLEACAAAGVERLVNAGSSSEYGYRDSAPSEDDLPRPNSDYAAAKAAATAWCGYFGRERGLSSVTLRLYSAYGPWEEDKRLVPTLVRAAIDGGLPPLVNPDIARDFVYVEDVCAAFLAASAAAEVDPDAIYNVASGTQTTLREIVAVARKVFEVNAEPEWGSMEDRDWDTSTWVGDPSKIERELGWKASTGLADGLRATAGWLER